MARFRPRPDKILPLLLPPWFP
ncbi:hypothetical protein CGRA01v4_15107 [Colletotrichum graminicola]|nr:hypothetical protein CGRA01v4_15107 [Colletotrichum graminicola]